MSKYFDGYAKFEYNEMSKDKLARELKKKVEYINTLHSSKDKEISQLKNELSLTNKALELACAKLLSIYCGDYCGETSNCEKIDCEYEKRSSPEFFKTKAKEIK